MLPRERVLKTLNHQEPDIVPWGEHWIDYNVYEDILGRKSFVHGKIKPRVKPQHVYLIFIDDFPNLG